MFKYYLLVVILTALWGKICGHGMVLDPVNRASRWREDASAPINYDDNGLFCGGRQVQWEQNNGKCGLCGDNYADKTPRTHELNGTFGQGVIVQSYNPGSVMNIQVLITANHLGYFVFKVCNMDRYQNESDECFEDIILQQPNGDTKYKISSKIGYFEVPLLIPKELQCSNCILQWTWTTGNSWGVCENGTEAQGCGKQETFRTCSDISIVP